jgi:transcriptional regulator with XRE-family HTH domain
MATPELEPGKDPAEARARDSLGRVLKRLLQRARRSGDRIKVTQLAKELNISKASLYAYLAGDTLPPTGKLDNLLPKLGIPPAEGRWFHELRDDIETRFQGKVDAVDSGPPLIEIMLPDGTVELADIEDAADVPAELKSLSGPYVIEQLNEYVRVNAERTIPRVDCRRRIRALTAGCASLLVRLRGASRCRPESRRHRAA